MQSFSIIIPAHNEEHYIAACLRALTAQEYGGAYEVIVVDSASTDATAGIAASFGARVIREEVSGIARALNTGCAHARCDVLAFTDADTTVPPDWLSRLADAFSARADAVAVGGPYVFYDGFPSVNFFTKKVGVPVYKKVFYRHAPFLPGSNMAVRADAFGAVGGFNEHVGWGQDADLCRRLREHGEIIFDDELVVATSFRRYRGEKENRVLAAAHGTKEATVTLARFVRMVGGKKLFAPQKPIRRRV